MSDFQTLVEASQRYFVRTQGFPARHAVFDSSLPLDHPAVSGPQPHARAAHELAARLNTANVIRRMGDLCLLPPAVELLLSDAPAPLEGALA